MSDSRPKGWVELPLGQVATVVTGKTPPTSDPSNYGGGIPFVKPGDLDGTKELIATETYLSERGMRYAPRLPRGSVLVSCIGNLGKVALLGDEGTCNQQINAILPTNVASPEFVYQWARTIRPWMELNSSATTVTIINKGRFERAPFLLPPFLEQNRIVKKIEELQSRSKRAREALESVPALIEKFRQSVLAAAFRGDLTKEWREKNKDKIEPASELLKRIRVERRKKWEEEQLKKFQAAGKLPKDDSWKSKYKEPEAVDTEGRPELPEGWCWVSVEELSYFVTSGSRGWANHYSQSGAVFLRVGNVDRWTINLDLSSVAYVAPPPGSEGERTKVQVNDLVLSITADVGMVALVGKDLGPTYVSQHLALIRPNTGVSARYFAYSFCNPCGMQSLIKDLQYGLTKTGLSLDQVRTFPVPIPSLNEQVELVYQLDRLLDTTLLNEELKKSKHSLQQLDEAVLAKAFRGELVPQDPNDEPASVLLERIRKEIESAVGKERKTNKHSNRKTRKTERRVEIGA